MSSVDRGEPPAHREGGAGDGAVATPVQAASKLDNLEFCWRLYNEHTTHGRHHETQRTTFSNFVFALAPVIYGVMRLDNVIDRNDLPLALLMGALAVVGALLSLKHYERFRHHIAQASQFRKVIGTALG